ncbi:MAG: rod shape-determining protein MreD [Lachnospiraceae bacterium]|nr:rod shape-determining protein MreD [Lachnospiraceae bacterium]
MRKVITYTLIIIAAFYLQTSVFRMIDLGGLVPDCLLVVTVSIALIKGSLDGCVTGFFCGLLTDVYFGSILGLFAMAFTAAGYLFGKFNRLYYKQDITLPLIIIAAADTIYNIGIYILFFLTRNRTAFGHYFLRIIVPEVFYTVITGIFIYLFIQLVLREKKKGGAKYHA